jgi:peptidoglycan lytic transglycosylase
VIVTINDRGPFVRGRIIDVSPAAAQVLGFAGLTQVSLDAGQ